MLSDGSLSMQTQVVHASFIHKSYFLQLKKIVILRLTFTPYLFRILRTFTQLLFIMFRGVCDELINPVNHK